MQNGSWMQVLQIGQLEASSMQRQARTPLVFVVDDDPSIVCTIVGLMKHAGFRTASAGDVAGALHGIREQHPQPGAYRISTCRMGPGSTFAAD